MRVPIKINYNDKLYNTIKLITINDYNFLIVEADNIFWVSVNEGQFPHIRANDIEEERRLAYVAISRTKKNLYISYLSMNKRKIAFPSEFLLDVQKCINKNIML